jgi:hypothetical protein
MRNEEWQRDPASGTGSLSAKGKLRRIGQGENIQPAEDYISYIGKGQQRLQQERAATITAVLVG